LVYINAGIPAVSLFSGEAFFVSQPVNKIQQTANNAAALFNIIFENSIFEAQM
jgi:hypothetical protein